jgi:succinate dehydrogenase/fumarate reductase-like Fe-S protein
MTGLSEFTTDPEPLTFEEQVWACPICGWAVELCPEHAALARDIGAEQEADMRRDDEA